MRRRNTPILALVLAALVGGAVPLLGGAQGATQATTPVANPQRPTQPSSGPGSTEALFGGVTVIEQIPPGQPQTDYWLFVPTDPLTESAAGTTPFPLVIFGHGSGGGFPSPYLDWIEHLVRRGAVVLLPEYQSASPEEAEYRHTLQDDVRGGLETLEREGVPVDVTQVAVVGLSLGGALAVDYAAGAAAAGLPVPTAVMGIAPSCLTGALTCLGADLSAIPAATRLLLVTEADDPDPTAPAAVARLWEGLDAVPLENRDIVTLATDGHGKPSLLAVHTQALAGGADKPDAFDWYGTWKWLDALMGCAFAGDWCEYALGNTPEQRFMGTWSDGVPVAEAIVSDDPA